MARARRRALRVLPRDRRDHLGAVGAAVIQAVAIQPTMQVRFALRYVDGAWLHFSLETIDGALRKTADRAYRWTGTLAQLQNVYARHPETIYLTAVKIGPPPKESGNG